MRLLRHAHVVLWIVFAAALGVGGCISDDHMTFDLQGHRGARGWLPENSISGFILAVDQGVDTVEMDVAVTADSQVVVSHEPWMSSEICSHPDGSPVSKEQAKSLNLFTMTYQTVAGFDCGSRGNIRFPEQQAVATVKPLLSDVIAVVDDRTGGSVRYNIEIKSRPEHDGVYHPVVDVFARLVHDVVAEAGAMDRTTVQSFDPRALEAFRRIAPESSLALLVDNEDGLDANLDRLSFLPAIYSPDHVLVDQILVEAVHDRGMVIVPWTVNDQKRMRELLRMGVDGLITDYPARGKQLKSDSI